MKRVAILMGGVTKEREISLRTGAALSSALKRKGYDVVDIDVGADVIQKINQAKPDVALIALHGRYGEDGCIQGMLEIMKIPYTGCGVLGSAIGMDKCVCRLIAKQVGLPIAEGKTFRKGESIDKFISALGIEFPVIVKPSREGSTINVSIVKGQKDLKPALEAAFESDDKIVVEKYIKGREVTIGVLNGRALTSLEVAPKSGFYDFESKYTKGKTEYLVPARISKDCEKKLQEYSEKIYKELEGAGAARVDFIVTEDESSYFLEINTIPGMTELSLVPKAAAYEGMSFDDLAEELLKGASLRGGAG